MLDILILMLAKAMIFALAGMCVRIQLALWRGFDLFLAVGVLLGAELFVLFANLWPAASAWQGLLSTLAAVISTMAAFTLWNLSVARIFNGVKTQGTALFILSLGASIAATGLIGFIRGPGLVQPALLLGNRIEIGKVVIGLPVMYTACVGLSGLVLVALWLTSRAGFSLELLSQNREFAEELGIPYHALIIPASLIAGLSAGIVGCSLVVVSGSTPEIGLYAFLYGAAAALVFQSQSLTAPIRGGLLLGCLAVLLQLMLAPALAEPILFAVVMCLLARRGSGRTAQGVR